MLFPQGEVLKGWGDWHGEGGWWSRLKLRVQWHQIHYCKLFRFHKKFCATRVLLAFRALSLCKILGQFSPECYCRWLLYAINSLPFPPLLLAHNEHILFHLLCICFAQYFWVLPLGCHPKPLKIAHTKYNNNNYQKIYRKSQSHSHFGIFHLAKWAAVKEAKQRGKSMRM